MAKWRRGGGGRRGRWVIEYVPASCEGRGASGEEEQAEPEPDPFTFDTPEAIRAALARLDVRMIEEKERIVDG